MLNKSKFTLFIVVFSFLICQISSDRLTGSAEISYILQTTVYVNMDPGYFYDYSVYTTSDGNIQIDIFDQNSSSTVRTFDQKDRLYYKAAYYNSIIVQQRNATNTVNYWIIQIVFTEQGLVLQSFSISSRVDNEGYQLNDDYQLTSILEYNKQVNYLYVTLQKQTDFRVYGIDLSQQKFHLVPVSWFYFNRNDRENIIGGNSRVLVQANHDQLWVDTGNVRKNDTDPTVYNVTNIRDQTKLAIYPGGSLVFNLIDTYFQYISIPFDRTKLTGFVYHGYGDQIIQGEVSLIGQSDIIYFSDSYNFFIAVSDDDIYMTIVDYNWQTKIYSVFSNTLKNTITSDTARQTTVFNFRTAFSIVYNDQKIYLVTQDNFYVYGNQPTYFTQLYSRYLDEPMTQYSDKYQTLFSEIQKYLQMPK